MLQLLERKDPLDESNETATDLLERALENGVQVEDVDRRRATDESLSFAGGLVLVQQHVMVRER
jgi:hypothetical protein